ncbi:hypothetical protein CHS0354_029331 [Potamilus streckersoni]|uniref:Protein AF-9 n=1 Tax=Potamilus streckersoni TaxID=2493646 RepID=A0AAE0T3C6_9BIVA|nr:hypothetical protein CHS0354_029331 [Potamilus streckersoni]
MMTCGRVITFKQIGLTVNHNHGVRGGERDSANNPTKQEQLDVFNTTAGMVNLTTNIFDDIKECVQVKIELGHKASLRTKPTKEGFTHDWTVFVQAPEGSNIAHFVEKVFVLPPGKYQSANLFGPPIKSKCPKKQKQPSAISSKEKVSKLTLNCSGDKQPSSSLKDISASLKSSDKQKLDKDHAAASTSSSSSSSAKKKVQQIQSSREKQTSKELINDKKKGKNDKKEAKNDEKKVKEDKTAVKSASASTISKTSSQIYSLSDLKRLMADLESSSEDDENDITDTNTKKTKSEHRKRSGSPLSALEVSMAKKQRVSVKPLSKVTSMELKEDLSLSSSSKPDDDILGEISGSDSHNDLDSSCSKTSNHFYSSNDLHQLMALVENISEDDEDDITDINAEKTKSEHRKRSGSPLSALEVSMAKRQRVNVKPLSKVTSMELKEDLSISSSSKPNDDILGEISGSDSHNDLNSSSSKTSNYFYSLSDLNQLMALVEDISEDDEDDITDPVNIFLQQKLSANNSPLVESRSSDISDTKNKTQNGIQLPTNVPCPVPKLTKDENKISKEKSSSKIDSINDVKSNTKTVVKDLEEKKQTHAKRSKDTKDIKDDRKKVLES